MPWIDLPDGTHVHIKMAKPRPKKCTFCGAWGAESLCDFVVGLFGETCDALMCARCRRHVHPDTDYCPKHWEVSQ